MSKVVAHQEIMTQYLQVKNYVGNLFELCHTSNMSCKLAPSHHPSFFFLANSRAGGIWRCDIIQTNFQRNFSSASTVS